MKEFNIDSFGEIMDSFIRDNEINMLLTLPKGTEDVSVKDNVGFSSVVHFYILLNAIKPICTAMCREMGIDQKSDEWTEVVSSLLGMVKAEMFEVTA